MSVQYTFHVLDDTISHIDQLTLVGKGYPLSITEHIENCTNIRNNDRMYCETSGAMLQIRNVQSIANNGFNVLRGACRMSPTEIVLCQTIHYKPMLLLVYYVPPISV